MKKIIIIGSSIAGASAACLLAKHCNVRVYEQKAMNEVGKKLCANVVTPDFLVYAKKSGLNPKKYTIYNYNKAIGYSKNDKVELKTHEFKIDRKKLIRDLVTNAKKDGAKFSFKTGFIDFKKKKSGYSIKLKKGSRTFTEECDILIGADGALSNVAKKAGLWKKRTLFPIIQTETPLNKIEKIKLGKKSYHIFFGRERGYYGYAFPYRNIAVIGVGERADRVREKYDDFLRFLGAKVRKKCAALVPKPQIIPQKRSLFVIGDAGCHIKFSGGGIVPAMMAAEAVKDIIVNKDYRRLKKLNRRTFMNRLATRVIERMNDKDFDSFVKILKDKKFAGITEKRDMLSKEDYLKLLDLRILKFLLKLF